MIKALLWDVDGTMAETERDGHRVAFNRAFEDFGLPWRWDVERYAELLAVAGGRERLLHDMRSRPDAPPVSLERERLARELHGRKNALYAELVHSERIALRDGVRALMDECRQRGVRMGIATTTSKSNVDALLRAHLGPSWTHWFGALVCGEDLVRKKPDPEVYLKALARMGLGPLEAVAIEDSPGGAVASRAAGVPVVVTRSVFFANATIEAAIAIGPGLGQREGWRPAAPAGASSARIGLDDLIAWRHGMEYTSGFG